MAYTSTPFEVNILSRRKKRRTQFSVDNLLISDLEIDSKPTSIAKITDSKNHIFRVAIGCENGDVIVFCCFKRRILARWSSGVDPVTSIHICNHSDIHVSPSVSTFLGTESGHILSVEGSLLEPNFIRLLGNIKASCKGLILREGYLLATSRLQTIRIPLQSSESRRKIQTIFAV